MPGFEDAQLAQVDDLFQQLLEAADRYRDLIGANLEHEQSAIEPHKPRVALMKAQLGTTERLIETLESTVLEQVIALKDSAAGPWDRAQFESHE